MMVEDAWKEGRKAWKLKRDGKKIPLVQMVKMARVENIKEYFKEEKNEC